MTTATAVKKDKKRVNRDAESAQRSATPGLTDQQRESAIARFLASGSLSDGDTVGMRETTWCEVILETGVRDLALAIAALASAAVDYCQPFRPGFPELRGRREGLSVVSEPHAGGNVNTIEVIPWGEIVEAAVDSDAGAERWTPPAKGKRIKPTEADERFRQIAGSERAAIARAAAAEGASTATPGGIQALDPDVVLTPQGPVPASQTRLPNGKPTRPGKGKAGNTREVTEIKPPNSRASASISGSAPSAGGNEPAPEIRGLVVGIERIEPNPFQPRQDFDPAKLEELAATLRTHGLLQSLLVRPKPGDATRYQLLAGERRLRAAKLAGLAEIRVDVQWVDDRRAAEIAIIENDQRQGLNPLEQAAGLQRLVEEFGFTQGQLAEQFSLSQPEISKRLGLLSLPERARQLVREGTLPPSHARLLVPWVGRFDGLVSAALQDVESDLKRGAGVESLEAFSETIVTCASRLTEEVEGEKYSIQHHRQIPLPTFSAEELERLNVQEVPRWDGQTVRRATNKKLFAQLWKKHEAAYKPVKAKVHRDAKSSQRSAKPRKALTPAQTRAAATEKAEKLQRAIDGWREEWLGYLVRKELAEREAGDPLFTRLLLLAAMEQIGYLLPKDVARLLGGEKAAAKPWPAIAGLSVLKLEETIKALVVHLFGQDDAGVEPLLGPLAATLKIDLAKAWKADLGGPLTEAFLDLCDDAAIQRMLVDVRAPVAPDSPATAKGLALGAYRRQFASRLPRCLAQKAKPAGKKAQR